VGSLSQFEENVGPLRRGHLSAGEGIRGIGFFEGVKNADYFLHSFILLWFRLDFPFWFRYLSIPAPQFTPAAFSPHARCMRSSQCENASAAVWRNWESPLETIRRLGTRLGFFQKPGGPANLPPALDPLSLSVGARALGNLGQGGLPLRSLCFPRAARREFVWSVRVRDASKAGIYFRVAWAS
jgi:hypothetical protein